MGPDDLDDLLASILAEGKKESALALYEGAREEDLVNEDVDERILRILGLDDVFDIDYGTYLTLLREKLAEARMVDKKISTDESMLLSDEFKRVKGNVGRFRIRRKKITAENLGVTGPIRVSTEKFYLTSKAVIPTPSTPVVESSEDIKSIEEAIDNILKSLTDQNKRTKKKADQERKSDEQRRRTKREAELEKPIQKAAALVKKIVAPFQSILDRIMRFIQFTLLGYFVDKVLKWFADPENERKIKVLGRFLKDWWPSLLAAYGLFATPFGLFVRSTLKMLRGFIPQMVRFMAAHPLVFGTAAAGLGAYAASQMNEQKRKEFKQTDPSTVLPEETAKTGKTPGVPQLQQEQTLQRGLGGMFSGGGRVRRKSFFGGGAVDRIVDVNDIGFTGGGGIDNESGVKITGAGPDTQLIAAQPGEVVISKKAVDKYGANFFLGLNKRAGGTNIPKMVNNIQLAQGGGMVGGFGRVMAPRTNGQNQWASKGARSVFQMFGMNVPGTEKPATYSSSDVSRYNKLNPNRSIQMGQSYKPLSGGGFGVAPTIRTVLKNAASQGGSFIRDSFRNFGSNVQTIKGSAQKQEQMMREMGVKPSGYVNLRGQPINLGPQSRSTAPGTPVISSKTQMIVLPPTTSVAQKPQTPTISGTQIPEFSIVANTGHRSMISDALGIADLVGA
jgi:ribosome-associated translation inhibitor RaiA